MNTRACNRRGDLRIVEVITRLFPRQADMQRRVRYLRVCEQGGESARDRFILLRRDI
jgi:predicted nucleic acid-binding Zn ribbon protein